MKRSTLPVHMFTELTKYEVTNRMECLINKVPGPCMNYCQMKNLNNKYLTIEDTWNCYEENDVPNSLYGLSKCNVLFPKITERNALQFLSCLVGNQIHPEYKQICQYLNIGNNTNIFDCYRGCLPDAGCDPKNGIPIDFDYCFM